ncbi:hypothetical protein FJ987_25815 [Mesorhizobium sp. CU2]|uniref:hypothetical protein n=1 Tax=unclassified Mesorhizobium TaxID=325217 RepID=UPI00112D6221|nr:MULTISPECIES: hypothetical protein [unclassified Mesorhizobium]TPN81046.1 hypothetical protein FJ988_19300 [Mesorhizobium sp. CU3]TPO05736.1 hypothetical protein FJ987_25815 [Mesorhizobium sp. CU2]
MPGDLSDWLAAGGLLGTAAAFLLSAWEMRGNRRATSASLYMSLAESMRAEWRAFDLANGQKDTQEEILGEILNLVEAGCACENDRMFAGRTRKILRNVIDDIQDAIDGNPEIKALASKLTTHSHTYEESEAYRSRRMRERDRESRGRIVKTG